MENELRERITRFNTERDDLKNDVESFCADISVDLDVRWKLFVDSKLGSTDGWVFDLDQFGIEYDDVVYEARKFQTINLVAIVSTIEDWINEYGSMTKDQLPDREKSKFGKFSNDLVIKLKEALMDEFTSSCIFDW